MLCLLQLLLWSAVTPLDMPRQPSTMPQGPSWSSSFPSSFCCECGFTYYSLHLRFAIFMSQNLQRLSACPTLHPLICLTVPQPHPPALQSCFPDLQVLFPFWDCCWPARATDSCLWAETSSHSFSHDCSGLRHFTLLQGFWPSLETTMGLVWAKDSGLSIQLGSLVLTSQTWRWQA